MMEDAFWITDNVRIWVMQHEQWNQIDKVQNPTL